MTQENSKLFLKKEADISISPYQIEILLKIKLYINAIKINFCLK